MFLSEDEYDRWLEEDAFLEHAEIYGHRSGVPKAGVERLQVQGQVPILRTDIQGARSLRDRLVGPLLVFVTAPDLSSLERRIRLRGAETEAEIRARLSQAEAEIAESHWFDVVIINRDGDIGLAARELVEAVNDARAALRDCSTTQSTVNPAL